MVYVYFTCYRLLYYKVVYSIPYIVSYMFTIIYLAHALYLHGRASVCVYEYVSVYCITHSYAYICSIINYSSIDILYIQEYANLAGTGIKVIILTASIIIIVYTLLQIRQLILFSSCS